MEPAAVLVRAFKIHHLVRPAFDLAVDARKAGEVFCVFQHEGMGAAGVEPDIHHVVDFFVVGGVVVIAKKPLRRAFRIPGVGALLFKCVGDAFVDALFHQRRVLALFHKHRDRHPPRALARQHPVGLGRDHAGNAVFAGGGNPAGLFDGGEGEVAERGAAANSLVHRNEPLRRVAEYHRLFGTPGMWILMLELAARHEIAGGDQRRDHRLIGVALVALGVNDALALKARRVAGEEAVGVNRVGNARVDAALGQHLAAGHPDIKIVAAMAGRGVDEAGAGVVSDVVAVEERDVKGVALRGERVNADKARKKVSGQISHQFGRFHFRGLEKIFC